MTKFVPLDFLLQVVERAPHHGGVGLKMEQLLEPCHQGDLRGGEAERRLDGGGTTHTKIIPIGIIMSTNKVTLFDPHR